CGERQALGNGPARAIAEGGRVVHVVLEHAGVGRAQDGEGHLVRDREQGVLDKLEADRITWRAHSTRPPGHGHGTFTGSTSPAALWRLPVLARCQLTGCRLFA